MKTFFLLLLAPFVLALSSGSPAPEINAKNQDGKTIRLSDYKGKFIVLFFYPKDETPGCTKEACDFRDRYAAIKEMNAVVFGVSRQDEESHKKFIAKHKLPFDLLVDTDGALGKAYGVDTIPVIGLSKRQSFLIGPDGKVLRFYEKVDPEKHTAEVMEDIKKAAAKAPPQKT